MICKKTKIVCLHLLLSAVLLFIGPRTAAQEEANYAVYANIIYHFTKYIDWPEYKKTGDFIIGVIGNNILYEELKKDIEGKTAEGQKIVIRTFSSADGPFNCHILFIGDDESNKIKKIISATAGAPMLLVSESEGLAEKGSCINFVIESEHLKLEINKNNIVQRELSIASELLQLGKLVK